MSWSDNSHDFFYQLYSVLCANNFTDASFFVIGVNWNDDTALKRIKFNLAKHIKQTKKHALTSSTQIKGCCKAIKAIVRWSNGERVFDL